MTTTVFFYIELGCNGGRASDECIFANSSLIKILENRNHNIPMDGVVGEEAFALKTYMMRPYPFRRVLDKRKRIFNYRLFRA